MPTKRFLTILLVQVLVCSLQNFTELPMQTLKHLQAYKRAKSGLL